MNKIKKLYENKLLELPYPWVADISYECIMGSVAYGVAANASDSDLYAICVPPKNMVFPENHIIGFGPPLKSFDVTQQHHIKYNGNEYDVVVYSIVKFFQLAADMNPNITDALAVPDRCVTYMDNIGRYMRDNRKKFYHKGCYWRFKGYAYKQLKKLKTKIPVGNRVELVEKHGWDTKFGYHIARLLNEVEELMLTGDLNLETSKEQLKAIRNGEWSLEFLENWFVEKERMLDQLYLTSSLPNNPNYEELKRMLLVCLEERYGNLNVVLNIGMDSQTRIVIDEVKRLINSI